MLSMEFFQGKKITETGLSHDARNEQIFISSINDASTG
jgi:hypothetical protein